MSLLQKLNAVIDFLKSDDRPLEIEESKQQTETSNAALLESPNELVVFGFIRIIENNLTHQQIIPLSIIQMVMTYYYIVGEVKIILSTQWNTYHSLQYISFQQEKGVVLNIIQDSRTAHSDQYIHPKQSCFIDNVPVPICLSHAFDAFFATNDQNYSAVINDLGSITYFPTIEVHAACDEIKALRTFCPRNKFLNYDQYDFKNKYREYIYSTSHGLICYDGNTLYQTFFDSEHTQTYETWQWNKLATSPTEQRNASLCWIKNYSFLSSQDDELFVCGGDQSNTANLFTMKDRVFTPLSSMPNARTMAGSYYDIYNKRVYVGGGGHGSAYSVDCYDFNKDRWIMYPDTVFPHSLNPILWMDGYVLFICGHQSNIGCIERYDIRSNSNHWCLADKRLQIDNIVIPCEIERVMSNKT